jgi:hypothetical protein
VAVQVQSIHLELANSMTTASTSGTGADAVISKAKAFERGHDYAKAIETYLSLTSESTSNLDALEQVRPAPHTSTQSTQWVLCGG